MTKDPAFLFYSSDFLVGTMLMSDEQVGKYIRLMCVAHQKNGYLNKQDMLKICGTYDEDIFSKFKKDENDIYYNERLISEINKRKRYSDSRRSNRKSKNDEKDNHMSNICKSHDEHMENENENINEINNKDLKINNYTWFEEFWKLYPRKVQKKTSEQKFKRIVKNESLFTKIISDIEKRSQSDDWLKEGGKYIPNPTTYLNQERWNDEIDYSRKTSLNRRVEQITDYKTVENNLTDDELKNLKDQLKKIK